MNEWHVDFSTGRTVKISWRNQVHVAEAIVQRALREQAGRSSVVILFGGEGNCHKTSLANHVARAAVRLGLRAAMIEIDSFAKLRETRIDAGISGYDPRSFATAEFNRCVDNLASGQDSVWIPFYDHTSGVPCDARDCLYHEHVVEGSDLLVGVGVFFGQPPQCHKNALTVFFRRPDSVSKFRSRIKRDVATRGYSWAQAFANYYRMRRDYRRSMAPFLVDCDIVISVLPGRYEIGCSDGQAQ